jgi:hypothetical protein
MDWTYEDEVVEELPEGIYGFIYELTFLDDKNVEYKYIGKKSCFSVNKLPALKSGEVRDGATRTHRNKNGKRIYYDIIRKEAKWKEYEGSSEFTTNMTVTSKKILRFCVSKRELTYREVYYQFKYDVLENPDYLNACINNQFFRNNLK